MTRFGKLLLAGGLVAVIGAGASMAQNMGHGRGGMEFEQAGFHMRAFIR